MFRSRKESERRAVKFRKFIIDEEESGVKAASDYFL